MTTGYVEKSVELQIADIARRALDAHYQGELVFGPIRTQAENGRDGSLCLTVYIVFDGDEDMLYPRWDSGALLPEHILPDLALFGITTDTRYAFIPRKDWAWFHKAQGLDF